MEAVMTQRIYLIATRPFTGLPYVHVSLMAGAGEINIYSTCWRTLSSVLYPVNELTFVHCSGFYFGIGKAESLESN